MKPFVIFVLLTLTSLAIPVHGDQYLTEAQKELLLEKSRALGLPSEKNHAQNASEQIEQTNNVIQQSRTAKSHQTGAIYLGVTTTSTRNQTQSLQSIFNNADWGTPTYSNHSVQQSRQIATTANNNRYVQQDERLATAANSRRPDRQSRQVAKTTKKFDWSSFFNNLSKIAIAINSGMNNTSSQFNPYIPQPTYFTPQSTYFTPLRTNQLIRTMSIGNHTINVGGDHELHTWDVGNQSLGTFDGKKVNMYNFGNFSTGTIGDQKVRCHIAGNIQFCK